MKGKEEGEKMEDKHLVRIGLMGTLVAILMLSFIGDVVPQTRVEIKEISQKDVDKGVYVEGTVDRIGVKGTTTFFTLKDETGSVQGVMFNKVQLNKGQKIGVAGKVQQYKGNLELVADEVRQI